MSSQNTPAQSPRSFGQSPIVVFNNERKTKTFDLCESKEETDILPPRCKIICTIGPACQSVDKLKQLVMAGMNVARLNFSHGDHTYHGQSIATIRQVMHETRRIIAIMLDTKGPEIRTGKLKDDKEVQLVKGQEFTFTTDSSVLGDNTKTSITYKSLPTAVKPGDTILCGDALLSFTVLSIDGQEVKCRVNNSGPLGNTKNVNLPGIVVDLPALTEKDISDIGFGVDQGIDFIAASFIRKADDVITIRKLLDSFGSRGKGVKIISKIENQQGLDNFDEILEVTDGVMIARGDLGSEIPIEQVALAQKMIIRKCNAAGKFVITATQMLESMTVNPSPTRAEASDVANAVFDGTDCVMLSGETAKGLYPVEAVKIMADICREAETNTNYRVVSQILRETVQEKGSVSVTEAIAGAAVKACSDLKAALLIVLTETGATARLVSKYRPRAPILTITSNEQTARQSLVSRGLFPLLVGSMMGTDSLISRVISAAQRLGMCKLGDLVVVTSGAREATAGQTNDLRIVQVSF